MSTTSIHPTAIIATGAEIGTGVTIGPCAVIGEKVRIGADCSIGPHAVIHPYVSMGPGCRVHAGAVLGDLPQDLGFKECESFVEIGSNCVFREGVTIHRGTKPGTKTVVGDNCYLMAFSHLAHNVQLGRRVILANNVMLAGYVEVGEGTFMGGGAGIHQFVRIGRLVMVGGNSGASKDIPPFCMMSTVGFNEVVGLNVVGMRRAGMTPDERLQVKRAFALLYRSGLNVSQAVERIRTEFKSGPALEFVAFVEASKRGICGMRANAAEAAAE